jgi:hypothetical protein
VLKPVSDAVYSSMHCSQPQLPCKFHSFIV